MKHCSTSPSPGPASSLHQEPSPQRQGLYWCPAWALHPNNPQSELTLAAAFGCCCLPRQDSTGVMHKLSVTVCPVMQLGRAGGAGTQGIPEWFGFICVCVCVCFQQPASASAGKGKGAMFVFLFWVSPTHRSCGKPQFVHGSL